MSPLLLSVVFLAACSDAGRDSKPADTATPDTGHDTDTAEPPDTDDTADTGEPPDTDDTADTSEPPDTGDTADTGEPPDTDETADTADIADTADTADSAAPDADGDGFRADDCDDSDASVHPGAPETCDERDEDCDGTIDEDAVDRSTWYADGDADGWGGAAVEGCTQPASTVVLGGDCDDADPAAFPGAAETCDGVDEDCNGVADDDPIDPATWYTDADGDGFGGATVLACEMPADATTLDGDCDDSSATVNPESAELCNSIDDDCDGAIDETPVDGVAAWADGDGDGYGAGSVTTVCTLAPGWSALDGDCDDADAAKSPAAVEVCWNGVDDDCDGADATDDDCAPAGTIGYDATASGGATSAAMGTALALDGDLNGDGRADLVVGIPGSSSDSGEVRVFLGPIEDGETLSELDADVRIYGTGGSFGVTVAVLDLDGDGDSELAIGDPTAGAVYVYAGSDPVDTSSPSWTLSGSGDFGRKITALPDTNGDGLPELAIGAPSATEVHEGAGAVYIYAPGDSTPIAVLFGELPGDQAGALLSAGDVNGDGVGDLAVSAASNASGGAGSGRVYLVYGPILGSVALGALGVTITGEAGDKLGEAMSIVGDLDADGYDELVIGNPADSTRASDAGAVGVWYGPVPPSFQGFAGADTILYGRDAGDEAGASVASAGDLDADGWMDLVVNIPGDDSTATNAGLASLHYGALDGDDAVGDALAYGSSARPGPSVFAGGGDLDGDGYPDLAFGSPGATIGTMTAAGYVGIVFGGDRLADSAVVAVIDPADDADGDGQTENGGDCDDTRAAAHADGIEVCGSGVDEDCDGFDNRCAPSGVVAYTATGSDITSTTVVRGIGDVNGDGWQDLAASVSDSTPVLQVLFGPFPDQSLAPGDATFSGDAVYSAYGAPFGPAGDFDGDGIDDFVVMSSTGSYGSVAVVAGSADLRDNATSAAPLLEVTGASSGSRVQSAQGVGDIDGDGLDDILVHTTWSGSSPDSAGGAFLFRGGTTGTHTVLEAEIQLYGEHSGDSAGSISTGCDLDADGQQDLIVGAPSNPELGGGKLYVFYGPLVAGTTMEILLADATLTRESEGSYIQHEQSVDCADLTGDGYADLAWFGAGPETQIVHGPIGPGAFELPEDADAVVTGNDTGTSYYDTTGGAGAIGDIDGDGFGDLLVANPYDAWSGAGKAYIVWGPVDHDEVLGDGGWYLEGVAGAVTGGQVDVVDLDGDPQADLIIVSTRSTAAMASLVHGGIDAARPWTEPHVVGESDDLDADGWTRAAGDCDDTEPSVFPGATEVCESLLDEDCDGWDRFCPPTDGEIHYPRTEFTSTNGVDDVVPLDANGDGQTDLLLGGDFDNEAYVVFGPFPGGEVDLAADADWIFTEPSGFSDLGRDVDTLGDIDGDGDDDFVVSDGEYPEAYVVLSDPGWTSQKISTVAAVTLNSASRSDGMGYAVAGLGDSDGDGIREVVASEWESGGSATGLAIWEITGTEGDVDFSSAKATIYTGTTGDAAGTLTALGDLDGDGLDDLALNQGSRAYSYHSGGVYLYFGDGLDGSLTYADADAALTGEGTNTVADVMANVGDLDGDGADDFSVGAMGTSSDGYGANGRAYVYYGGPARGTNATLAGADLILTGVGTYARVGTGVVGADLDADGHQDFGVMAQGYYDVTGAEGGMYWMWGPVTQTGTNVLAELADARVHDADGDGGSMMRALGDVDADGFDDLLVTVGGVAIWSGGPR